MALVAGLIVGLMLLGVPGRAQAPGQAQAPGRLEIVATFTAGSAELSVAHYTEPAGPASTGRVGLIGIAAPNRNSFAFSPAEWARLIDLCDKAAAVASTGWTEVGALRELGTADPSRLTVRAGPGVKFEISSPKAGMVSHVVAKAELPRLRKAFDQVRDYLAK
jgi:hypothetical protein